MGTSPAVVLAPPLRGKNWVAINGCCASVTSHRGAVMAVNGQLRVPERFAIDWVQLDSNDRLYGGDIAKLASYPLLRRQRPRRGQRHRRQPVRPGRANRCRALRAKGITTENIGGNMLVIDIGGGRYVFYAHLQPGSLKVKVGDKVKTGDVLGQLGNTGNSDAPHLHFHVMDGPSPLDAHGLPFVFTHFTGIGVVDSASQAAVFGKGAAAIIDRSALTGPHRNQMPLNDQVVDFGP